MDVLLQPHWVGGWHHQEIDCNLTSLTAYIQGPDIYLTVTSLGGGQYHHQEMDCDITSLIGYTCACRAWLDQFSSSLEFYRVCLQVGATSGPQFSPTCCSKKTWPQGQTGTAPSATTLAVMWLLLCPVMTSSAWAASCDGPRQIQHAHSAADIWRLSSFLSGMNWTIYSLPSQPQKSWQRTAARQGVLHSTWPKTAPITLGCPLDLLHKGCYLQMSRRLQSQNSWVASSLRSGQNFSKGNSICWILCFPGCVGGWQHSIRTSGGEQRLQRAPSCMASVSVVQMQRPWLSCWSLSSMGTQHHWSMAPSMSLQASAAMKPRDCCASIIPAPTPITPAMLAPRRSLTPVDPQALR